MQPGEPSPNWFSIRAETHADEAAVADVVRRAFVTHPDDVADLVAAIRTSPEYVPELALVATAGAAVVGFVMASGARLRDADGAQHPVLTLSPLAVAPESQRQGVGSALVEALAARADARGEPMLVLEGDPRYYSRLGFASASAFGITIPLPDWAPVEAAQVRTLSAYDPAIRGALEYPPAFDAVSAH